MTLSLGLSVRPLPLTIRHYRVTLETCDLWDIWSEWWRGMTWLDYFGAILETCDLYDICSEWWGDLTWPKKPLRCCDIWDTNYNTDNWEPEFMTIFVTWQLIVTLDNIRNSCDVFSIFSDCISGYSRVTIGPLIFAINLKCWSIRNILWGHMKVVCPGSKDQTLIFGTFDRIGIFDFEHETWNAQPETVFISFHCIVC